MPGVALKFLTYFWAFRIFSSRFSCSAEIPSSGRRVVSTSSKTCSKFSSSPISSSESEIITTSPFAAGRTTGAASALDQRLFTSAGTYKFKAVSVQRYVYQCWFEKWTAKKWPIYYVTDFIWKHELLILWENKILWHWEVKKFFLLFRVSFFRKKGELANFWSRWNRHPYVMKPNWQNLKSQTWKLNSSLRRRIR